MIDIIKSAIIGFVEGITEWLPISSTGHMILLNEFIRLDVSSEFWELFLVVIQLGAILAVVVIFWDKLWPFSLKKDQPKLKESSIKTWLKVVVAVIPAAVLGLLLEDWMDEHFYNYKTVAIALIVYGIWFVFLERKDKPAEAFQVQSVEEISYRQAFLIGCFQCLSLIPGTSRSGSTIIGGMILGVSRPAASEFTFWLAIPVMAGASFLKLLKFGLNFTGNEIAILLAGMLVAFVVSLASIKFLMNYVKNHSFRVFGIYRIVLGIAVLLYFYVAGQHGSL